MRWPNMVNVNEMYYGNEMNEMDYGLKEMRWNKNNEVYNLAKQTSWFSGYLLGFFHPVKYEKIVIWGVAHSVMVLIWFLFGVWSPH